MSDQELLPHEFAAIVKGHLDGNADQAPDQETVTESDTDEAVSTQSWTEDAQGNLHGPDGKFIPKGEVTGDETIEGSADIEDGEDEPDELELDEDDSPAPVLEVDDPEVQAFLAKYNGDPVAALKAATHAQSLIGRQSGELGELRALVEGLKQSFDQQALQPQINPLSLVNFPALLEDDPAQAAQLAYQAGDEEAIGAAVSAWSRTGDPEDAFAAAVFWNQVQNEKMFGALVNALQDQAPPAAQSDNDLGAAVSDVMRRHPDIEKSLPVIGELAQSKPYLGSALENGTPQERASALEDLYLLARGRDSDTLKQEATKRVTEATKQAARKARSDAAVVSATRGSAASDGPAQTGVDRFREAFAARTGLPAAHLG